MDAAEGHGTHRLRWLDDVTRTALGVLVGGGGFLMLATAWWRGGPQELQGLASVLLGLVGTVVGYYFGSRGIERAEAQAVLSLQARDEMERIVEETHRRVQQAGGDGAENEAARRRLRFLAEEYEVLMEQVKRDESLIQRMHRLMHGGDEDAGGTARGLR